MTPEDVKRASDEAVLRRVVTELQSRKRAKFNQYFPDTGPLSRQFYPKHLAYMRAGAEFRQRLFLAGNRVGKSDCAAFEVTCHLTGLYPDWWQGRRFTEAGEWWAAGDTSTTARDIIQVALLGPLETMRTKVWTGMLPSHLVMDVSRRRGIPDAAESIWVRHVSGKNASLSLKSYDQRREAFQGTAKQGIWLDEECDPSIYGECLIRTMTTNGLLMLTMTPLMGLTQFIDDYLNRSVLEVLGDDGQTLRVPAKSGVLNLEGVDNDNPDEDATPDKLEELGRYVVMAGWDDAPHLDAKAKAEMAAEFPPSHALARSKGVPSLGSGTIYPVPENEIKVKPFEIPKHWKRVFGMDTDAGNGWTAAVWLAIDVDSKVVYLTDCYKRQGAETIIHAEAIKARGKWIPGVADAAALRVTEHDAEQLIKIYKNHGLDIVLADKAVEAGIQAVWAILSTGRLRVFSSCTQFFNEYRLYRRDEKGQIVKKDDHLCDSVRYAVRGMARAKTEPIDRIIPGQQWEVGRTGSRGDSWLSR